MTAPTVDAMIADNQDRRSSTSARRSEVSYVLVADADVQRSAACLESIKAFNVGVLVARDGEEALGILHRFGPPILLITDLSLPRRDGFALIEAVREVDAGRTEIIAWSAVRELREFAAHRLAGLNVRILSGAVSPSVLRGAIERALRTGAAGGKTASALAPALTDDAHRAMTELSDRARAVTRAAGAAVYLRAAGQTKFRAAVTWMSDVPMPDAPQLPRVFDMVVDTGVSVVLRDLAVHPLPGIPATTQADTIRGIAAVPIMSGMHEILGAICVFDVKPLDLSDDDIDALKMLGGSAMVRPRAEEVQPGIAPMPGVASAPPPAAAATADTGKDEERDVEEERREPVPVALLDRRGGDQAIARELARVRREQRQLSVILFDVDRAPRSESSAPSADPFGEASDTLTRAIRGSDLAIQWSRDELLVVLPGLSGTEARQVAERVRAAMQAGARHQVSVAGGVAELLADESVESAVARANEKVRLARERGHNRVG
jgi:diguanylate cyclase (GGDEF)-like protein